MWKEPTNSLLAQFLSPSAVDLCIRYFAVIKTIDEVAAGRQAMPEIATAFADYATGFVGNEFFQKHRTDLVPVMALGIKSWADAIQAAASVVTDDDKVKVVLGRRAFHDVAVTCGMLTGVDTASFRAALSASEVL